MIYRILTLLFALTALAAAKDVTIVVIEKLNAGRKGAPYDGKVLVKDMADDAVLFEVMMEAQNTLDFSFDFTSHKIWGAFITTINGITAESSQKEYWQILGGPKRRPTQFGASSYIPTDGEEILFRLVTWDREPGEDPTEEYSGN